MAQSDYFSVNTGVCVVLVYETLYVPCMPPSTPAPRAVEPIFISIKDAAQILSLTPAYVYELCDEQVIESQYAGRRRLVRLASVRSYADALPTERPAS